MSKLNYPANGLYILVKPHEERFNEHMSEAISNSNFDIPSDFQYKNYLDSLSDTLREYYSRKNEITSKIRRTDAIFSNISDVFTVRASRIITPEINKRERLIR